MLDELELLVKMRDQYVGLEPSVTRNNLMPESFLICTMYQYVPFIDILHWKFTHFLHTFILFLMTKFMSTRR